MRVYITGKYMHDYLKNLCLKLIEINILRLSRNIDLRRYNNIVLWDIGNIIFKHEDKIYSYYTDKEFIKDFIKIENEDVEKNIKNFLKNHLQMK